MSYNYRKTSFGDGIQLGLELGIFAILALLGGFSLYTHDPNYIFAGLAFFLISSVLNGMIFGLRADS